MQDGVWKLAKQKPIAIVLLGILSACVLILPFVLWNTEKAAEFFGAFSAAIVAAISILVAAAYQADLTRKRDDALRQADLISEAKLLFLWLDSCITRLERNVYRLDAFADAVRDGKRPQVEQTFGNFRMHFFPIPSDEAIARLPALAKFPIDLALSVQSAIGTLANEFGPRSREIFRDDLPVGERDFRHWSTSCRRASDLLKVAQSQIANVMQKRYAVGFPMPADILIVAERVSAESEGI